MSGTGGLFAFACWLVLIISATGQEVSDYAVQVSARTQPDPPRITLNWSATEGATAYYVARKTRDAAEWGLTNSLDGNATSYMDSDVAVGDAYEYHVWREAPTHIGHGYVYAGIQVPLVESRGKVILIVDSSFAQDLVDELSRLRQDLVGDGWKVLRHDVPRMAVPPASENPSLWTARSNEVASVRTLIKSDYAADPANVNAVFLFGHVPVPYSGAFAPDFHPDHIGAWPADVYYADVDGIWTDASIQSTTAGDPRNRNVPGDGKFDQIRPPGKATLAIGRVDMANLPTFPLSEVELLRQYLTKDHRFRHKLFSVRPRGLVQDQLGFINGEGPAADGWGNFAALFGRQGVEAGRWLSELNLDDYLFAYGCGPGIFTRAAGVVETSHFLVYDTRAVFTMLFGSYFGDWDSENNLLRAQLATTTYTLTSAWAGRPFWYLHHMGLGEPIGFSARLSQNNTGLYLEGHRIQTGPILQPGDGHTNKVHIALMGDPTLRLHPVRPPNSLVALTNASGGVDLLWSPSADPVVGYHVYRGPSVAGPYTRLNNSVVQGTAYTDSGIASDHHYMVRAVALEETASGSYYNASQGVFAEIALPTVSPDDGIWPGRGIGAWKITDALGTAGSDPGWDFTKVEGALNVTASFGNQFTVRIYSLSAPDFPGPPANFDSSKPYAWPILNAPSGIIGFDRGKIELLTSEFMGDLSGGTFDLALSDSGRGIDLVFTPNQPPSARAAMYFRPWDAPLRVNVADLLAGYTSDPDGDARALAQVGASTNGTRIFTENNDLVFSSTNNLRETVEYWVQDIRNYRAGDSVRMASGTLTIQPIPEAPPLYAHHAIELEWESESGRFYQVQFREETASEWTSQGPPIAGTGQLMSLFERTSNPRKFYRVILVK